MSRSQQSEVFNTEQENSATNETAAQKSDAATQSDISNQQSQLAKFAADNPYVQGGQMETTTNRQLSGTADSTAAAAKAGNQQLAQRTGANASTGVAAGEAEQEAAQRTLGTQEASATQSRLAAGSTYGQDVLSDQNQITAAQQNLASQESNAAQGESSTEESAAQQSSFMDELGKGLISGADSVGTAYCPARGSMILMADGTQQAIETLTIGSVIEGIDGEPQVVEEIQSARSIVLKTEISGGFVVRTSPVHAWALPKGGFTVATRANGKVILTKNGAATVLRVTPDGMDAVYNVITDGSHTYRANGAWSLGVGEAERAVSMDQWEEIGERMMQKVGA
jgi:hypothetical protein